MKRQDLFKYGTVEQIAEELCNAIDNISREDEFNNCNICPASNTCRRGHTGFIDWVLDDVAADIDGLKELEERIIQETLTLIDDGK